MLKIYADKQERQLLVDALAEFGKPLVNKQKPTRDDQKKINSIEKLIQQIHWGREFEDE